MRRTFEDQKAVLQNWTGIQLRVDALHEVAHYLTGSGVNASLNERIGTSRDDFEIGISRYVRF